MLGIRFRFRIRGRRLSLVARWADQGAALGGRLASDSSAATTGLGPGRELPVPCPLTWNVGRSSSAARSLCPGVARTFSRVSHRHSEKGSYGYQRVAGDDRWASSLGLVGPFVLRLSL